MIRSDIGPHDIAEGVTLKDFANSSGGIGIFARSGRYRLHTTHGSTMLASPIEQHRRCEIALIRDSQGCAKEQDYNAKLDGHHKRTTRSKMLKREWMIPEREKRKQREGKFRIRNQLKFCRSMFSPADVFNGCKGLNQALRTLRRLRLASNDSCVGKVTSRPNANATVDTGRSKTQQK